MDPHKGPGAPLPPTLVFAFGFLLAWWWHGRFPAMIDGDGASGIQRAVGWALVALGAWIFLWGLRTFARARTGIMLQRPAIALIAEGPYRWSRNPMYVGFSLIYFGFVCVLNTLWPVVTFPLVVLIVNLFVIGREERYLKSTFGTAYEEYCRRVGRWL
jgi:protein-S-isoprenylcysteine O-methyltransferase Ste14